MSRHVSSTIRWDKTFLSVVFVEVSYCVNSTLRAQRREGSAMAIKTFGILLFCLFTRLSAAEPPQWFIDGYTKSVSSKSHLIGLGSGDSHASATDKALADLTKHIEVSIFSESESYLSSFQIEDHEAINSQYESTIHSVTKGGITGAEKIEKSADDGTHYIMMAISRKVYLEQLITEIKLHRHGIAKMREDSRELIDKGKVIQGLGLIMETIDTGAEVAAREALYLALSGSSYKASPVAGGQAVISEVRRLIGRIKLHKLSGENQSALRGDMLADPLIIRAVFITEVGGEIPLSTVKFRLSDEQGKAIDTRICDEDGIVAFRISAMGRGHSSASVGVNLISLPAVFKSDLKNLAVTFDFEVMNTITLPLSVHITDEKGMMIDQVTRTVANLALDLGHVVLKEAPLRLKGIIRLDDQREIDGMWGVQFIAMMSLNLELVIAAEDKTIGSLQISAKGIHKSSKEHAVETGYRKMVIAEKKMAEMIARASSTLTVLIPEISREAYEHGMKMYKAGNYREAIRSLSQVTVDQKRVRECKKVIEEIMRKLTGKG